MAEPRVYIASVASIIAINGQGQAIPLGLVQNLTLTKTYVTEGIQEWGSFAFADIVTHGYDANFSWGRAWAEGLDLVGQGLVPTDAEIPQFVPLYLRVVDKLGQRNIALIHKGVITTYTIGADARAILRQNCTGTAISLLLESEIN